MLDRYLFLSIFQINLFHISILMSSLSKTQNIETAKTLFLILLKFSIQKKVTYFLLIHFPYDATKFINRFTIRIRRV